MTDKEKIRAEVERLRKSYQIMYQELDCESPELMSVCAKRNLCQDILIFIDSLQEEPVSDDLGEATNNYVLNVRKGYPRVMDKTDRYIYNAFEAGAQWQRRQMMKDAVEVDVWNEKPPHITYFPKDLKGGDKVKLIIIKED